MTEVSFNSFSNKHRNWTESCGVWKRDSDRYQRLKIEVTDGGLTHIYTPSIDIETGGIYLDCRKRKIFAKHVTLAVTRPVHTLVKTIWHLTMIGPLATEIYQTARGDQSVRQGFEGFGRSIADSLRTPWYGTLMTLNHLYGIVEALFAPNNLYKSRDRVGDLERKMLRVEKITDGGGWLLSPCFSPFTNIATVHQDYPNFKTNEALQDYAERQIHFRQTSRVLFNDCCMLAPTKRAFTSAAHAPQ